MLLRPLRPCRLTRFPDQFLLGGNVRLFDDHGLRVSEEPACRSAVFSDLLEQPGDVQGGAGADEELRIGVRKRPSPPAAGQVDHAGGCSRLPG